MTSQNDNISEWLLFKANSTIFQLYHGENKLIITSRKPISFLCHKWIYQNMKAWHIIVIIYIRWLVSSWHQQYITVFFICSKLLHGGQLPRWQNWSHLCRPQLNFWLHNWLHKCTSFCWINITCKNHYIIRSGTDNL
jgi:hypothetical protein